MSRIKNGGLDQSGAGPFEQQQFGTAVVEGVNIPRANNEAVEQGKYCFSCVYQCVSMCGCLSAQKLKSN